MGKIIMQLHLPEPKVRKCTVRAVQKHKDKSKYTRKRKHKATDPGGLMLTCPYVCPIQGYSSATLHKEIFA